MKIKNYDIVILLSILLTFSLGIGFLYSIKNSKDNTTKETRDKVETQVEPTSTVGEAKKAPSAPSDLDKKKEKNHIYKKEDFTIEEIFNYIIDWAKAASDNSIIKFLKAECPKDKIVEIVKKIVKETELSRDNKLNIIFSMAEHFKDDKNIKDKLFNVIIEDDILAIQEPPVLVVAVQTKHEALIPDLLDFGKRNIEKVKANQMDKKALHYAAKNDIPEYLEGLHRNIEKIPADMASKLLLELVKANKPGNSIPFLVKIGANINYYDDKNNLTILMHAIKNKNLDLVKTICEAGADVEKPSKDKAIGYPLQLAREVSDLAIEMYLQDQGARD